MKEQSHIPTSKVQRATRFVKTGAKVGGNYLKYYTKRAFNQKIDRNTLHDDNAADIYDGLSELKGSALKVLQMMSMDKNLLPTAYTDRFTMAQYSAPPLSYPLVVKTFQQYLGKSPGEIFDTFTKSAANAASIGQVHQATLKGKKYAVKIQYPGVAESVSSDLRIVRPFAVRILNINERDLDYYMAEVEGKLLEETDYHLEMQRSIAISQACAHIDNLAFPQYYPELSCEKIITMEINQKYTKEEYKTAKKRVEEIQGFYWNLASYIIVNLFFTFLDLRDGDYDWAFWPLVGWGIGVFFHAIETFGFFNSQSWKDRMVQKELERRQREREEFNSKFNN